MSDYSDLRGVVTTSVPLMEKSLKTDALYTEEMVDTAFGQVLVAHCGDMTKPAIVTYHDIGLNHVSNFQSFFNYGDMADLLGKFRLVHLNAPGQEQGAAPLPETYIYPTMADLGEQVQEVLNHLSIAKYIGVGVGLGANVLLRHALTYPERVDSLMIVNATSTKAGWVEWGYQKRNVNHLRTHGITQAVLDYLMWHHFGYEPSERAHDLVTMYKTYFEKDINSSNLGRLVEQYIARTDINLTRGGETLQVPVLNLVGGLSPFVDETVTLNGRLAPEKTNWLKVQDSAMVLDEQPGKVCEAFRLFLQGQGFCLSVRKLSAVGPTL